MSQTTRTRPPATGPQVDAGVDRRVNQAWMLVARREVLVRLTDKAFLIGTLVSLLIIAGFLGWTIYDDERAETYTVAVAPGATEATARLLADAVPRQDDQIRIEVEEVADEAAAVRAVRDESADVLLRPANDGWELVARDEVPGDLLRATQDVVAADALTRNAAEAGTSVDALRAGGTVESDVLSGEPGQAEFAEGLGVLMAFLFYFAALAFGYVLAGSVVEEKASRIVEIIATRIPVRQLLIGKIVGNVLLALMQVALFVVVGVIGLSFTEYGTFLPGVSAALGWFAAFFLLGFVLLACWWAVAGALASRAEDLQSTATPLSFLIMAVFFSSFLFDGAALTVASYVPPFSSILMPMRLLQDDASWWEPVLALGLLLLAAAATVVLAERLYRRALLQTQGRVSLRQAWTSAE